MSPSSSSSWIRLVALGLAVAALGPACQCSKPPPTTPTLKNKGETCARDEECKTGLCEAAPGFQTVCMTKCADGCGSDEVCTQLTQGRFACAPDRGGLCRPCQLDADCPYPADKCLMVDGLGVCGRDCTFDQNCPTSYRCLSGVGVDGRARANQCQPASGSCTCTAASAGQTISCETTNGFGTCRGVRTCDGVEGYGACDARTPAQETCNTIDDDCDGLVDEDQPMVTCGVGACERRLPSCGDAGVLTCTPGMPSAETCNGIDDDCNGVVDNGFDTATDVLNCGMCGNACTLAHASPRCVNRGCEVLSCDLNWGNCDGLHPNGCEANLLTDVNNCGACNNRCQAPGSTGACTNGSCTYTCAANRYDLDGDPSNGCEYACTFTSAVDEPDVNFTDANCDGMDGELTNGIYVSPVGDDTYIGSMAQPKRTIAAAVAAAVTLNKRDVYVSAGSYSGPVTLSNVQGKNIAGGYAPGTTRWTRSPINSTIITGGNPALSLTSVDNLLVQFITFRADSASGQEANGDGRSSYGGQVKSSTNTRLELLTLVAGDGSAGAAGTNGSDGASGGNGGAGIRGCANDTYFGCSQCARPLAGTGGTSACGRPGGAGGQPGLAYNSSSFGSAGFTGQVGTPAGAGGPYYNGTTSGYTNPQPNQRGTDGVSGTNGSNGSAPSPLGTLTVAGYLPPLGTTPTSGGHGNGGGGGGGGGGGCQDWVVGGILTFCWCYTYGSSGGGGGGGGCAGTAGSPGRSGGGSIGLMLWNSQVAARNLSLQSARGGNGGAGGSGGSGGTGGSGSASVHDYGSQGYSGIGGRGGNGGNGGAGGHGAGGAGGPSIGLLRNSASTINTSQVSYSLGTAGTGGSSMGFPGPAGTVAQDQTL